MYRLRVLILTLILTLVFVPQAKPQSAKMPSHNGPVLVSPAFNDGGEIPSKYTADAPDRSPVSPPLSWSHAPADVVSYVLLMFDLDSAVAHRTDYVLHWMMFNIPGTTLSLPEAIPPGAQLPDGSVQGLNLGKRPGYLPPGAAADGPVHHYSFELFALDTTLNLGKDATLADVNNAMQGHILVDRGILIGRFHRQLNK